MTTTVDEQGRVLDDEVECPTCQHSPSQMLGGHSTDMSHVVRYRCAVDECQREFRKSTPTERRRRGPR